MDEPYWCPFGKSEGWMPPELDGNPWSKGRIKLVLTAGKIRETEQARTQGDDNLSPQGSSLFSGACLVER